MGAEASVETAARAERAVVARRPAKETAARARAAAQVSNAAGLLDLLLFCGLIGTAYALVLRTHFHWLACIAAFLLIAKGQNGLLLSGHEAIHFLLFRSRRLNDAAGRWLCFGTMGVAYERARAAHFDHHRYLLSDRDEKLDQQLQHPTRGRYLAHLLVPLFGGYLLRGVLRLAGWAPSRRAKPQYRLAEGARRRDLRGVLGATAVLFVGLTALDWRLYLFFWAVPLLTVTAFFHNAKAFLDHARFADEADDAEPLFSYRVSLLDRLFFAVHQARHGEHHLFPYVPYYRLNQLDGVMQHEPQVTRRRGYFHTLVRYWLRVGGRG